MTAAAPEPSAALLTGDPPGAAVEIGCPFCAAGTAHLAATGSWTNSGTAYTQLLYVHPGCPAADPNKRSARPALLTTVTTRRAWWRRPFSRST